MTKTKLVIANWKMHKTQEQVNQWIHDFNQHREQFKNKDVKIGICPPNIYIKDLMVLKSDQVDIGSQNAYYSHEGAFTGECSSYMLKSIGVCYVIIGHSERRKYFKEDNQLLLEKLNDALYCGLTPILCVGETQQERAKHLHYEVVKEQLSILEKCFDKSKIKDIIIAYEPVWAIGTGINATPEQAQEMHLFIRNTMYDAVGNSADNVIILYGGSCKPDNARELFEKKDIDGALVGGASLKMEDFIEIITA